VNGEAAVRAHASAPILGEVGPQSASGIAPVQDGRQLCTGEVSQTVDIFGISLRVAGSTNWHARQPLRGLLRLASWPAQLRRNTDDPPRPSG